MSETSAPPPAAEDASARKRKKTLALVTILIVVLAAIGIGLVAFLSAPAPPTAPKLGALLVIPNQVTLEIGEVKFFQARATSTEGRVLQASEVSVSWSLAPATLGSLSRTSGLDTNFTAALEGTAVLTATGTAGGVTLTAHADITVNPPPIWADHYVVAAPASTVEGDAFDVTVTVYDQTGALFLGYRGTVHVTVTDADARVVVPTDYAFLSADGGAHRFSGGFRLYTAGTQTITVTDAANATVTGSDQIQVVANAPPVASFTYTKNQLLLNVDASGSSDADGTVVSYAWQWGDSATGTGVTAAHTYAAQGVYLVNLTVTDDRGATGASQRSLSFRAPTANFTFTRTGHVLAVDAANSTDPDGAIVSYAWTFGDGNTGAGVTTSHTYTGDGDYAVGLTVIDNDGFPGTLSRTASFHSPLAAFRVVRQDNLTIDVDGSASSDSDGVVVSWAWDWGDTTTGTGAAATHTYATKGTYMITLTVTDDIALRGAAFQNVTVRHAPIAFFTVGVVRLTANVDGSGSSDPDGVVVAWDWDWGDTTTGTGAVASHAYAVAGSYLIVLTVTDNDGLTDRFQRPVTVGLGPIPPSISFTLRIDGRNFTLIADASASFDPDGVIVSYAWDWGDTTTGSGVIATHSYAVPGGYTVTLVITDNDALTNSSNAPVSWFPPTASFTLNRAGWTVSANGTASSDPDGIIVAYAWDWGDGNRSAGATPSHTYGAGGSFLVALNVTDADGFWDVASQTVTFNPPTASFQVVRDLLTVNVDAGASFDTDGTITSYAWDWGDTTTGAGVTAAHTYATGNAYTITLTVTDNDLLTDTAARIVSVGGTTYDYHYYDFFRVPYGEWWDVRTPTYGDLPIGADCFNATSIADGECAGTTSSQYPYTNWYPAPGNINPGNPNANPMLQSLYRWNVTGRNSPAYTADTPVILPTRNPAVPGGTVQLDWTVQYMDRARALLLQTDAPWNGVVDSCGNLWGAKDGFILEATLTMRMDYNESRRIFDVAGDPATWWTNNVATGCVNYGPVESWYENWLVGQGGSNNVPGAYDIFSSYEYFYGPFFTDIVWSVTPGPGGNVTTVTIHHGTWGFEILMGRWFHYGSTTYADAMTLGTPARGWWGMELGWFEDFHMTATIGSAFDFFLSAVMAYHFTDVGMPGPDGTLGTNDDYSAWAWYPLLADYILHLGPRHPYSEMDPYAGLTYLHDSPGSRKYATQWAYELVPHVWNLQAGETLTFHFPTTPVRFYDPVASPRVSDPATLVSFSAALRYDTTRPAGLGAWDATSGVWRSWGPTAFPAPALPLYGDSMAGIWLRS